nr:hypothetical protein [Frankia alni]
MAVPATPVRLVTAIAGVVVGLTFLFGLGNVAALGIHLGVPTYVAVLVAPAVDLSVVGLLGTRYLALHHGPADVIRSARRLLIFASLVTLALNIAEPLITGHYGKAAFDAVGPLLLIGWSEIGPRLLQAMQTTTASAQPSPSPVMDAPDRTTAAVTGMPPTSAAEGATAPSGTATQHDDPGAREQDLLHRARAEDVLHWQQHQRPISAETLRKRLAVGMGTARGLVTQLRTDTHIALDTRDVRGNCS